jgi:hypothetical protein
VLWEGIVSSTAPEWSLVLEKVLNHRQIERPQNAGVALSLEQKLQRIFDQLPAARARPSVSASSRAHGHGGWSKRRCDRHAIVAGAVLSTAMPMADQAPLTAATIL